MDPESILTLIEENGIQLVRFLFCDTSSIIRGKATAASGLLSRINSGIGIVKGTMAMNMVDDMQTDTGYGATGEVRLIPDLETFRVLPYAPSSALMLCDLVELDRTPWTLCPRSILKRQLDQYLELGIRFEAAFEPEFFLYKPNEREKEKNKDRLSSEEERDNEWLPLDTSNCFSTDGMNKAALFIDDFIKALLSQNLSIEQYHPELGHGQHELSITHAAALTAADNHIIYRETLRGVANLHNLAASLAPKPAIEGPGNGCHLHLSAWDTDTNTNLFYSDNGLSNLGKCFVAGVLRHLPAITALTCASVNSYRRLKPKSWSSAFVCWGYENREAAIRVPSLYWDRELESANIEIKCVDNSANPYLALAAIIAAGMDGVKRKMTPQDPVSIDPSIVSASEAAEKKIERLPPSLKESLKKLLMDQILIEALGEEFARVYLKVKTSEDNHFGKLTVDEEIRAHFLKF